MSPRRRSSLRPPTAEHTPSVRVGDIVEFGYPGGAKTRAHIVSVAQKTAGVELLERRGKGKVSAIGSRWRIPLDDRLLRVVSRRKTREASRGKGRVPATRTSRGRSTTGSRTDVVAEVLRAEGVSEAQMKQFFDSGEETEEGDQGPSWSAIKRMLRRGPPDKARRWLRERIAAFTTPYVDGERHELRVNGYAVHLTEPSHRVDQPPSEWNVDIYARPGHLSSWIGSYGWDPIARRLSGHRRPSDGPDRSAVEDALHAATSRKRKS